MTAANMGRPDDRPENLTPNPYPPEQPRRNLPRAGEFGAEYAKGLARDYAMGRAAQIAARTALGARFFTVTRWLFLAEWGALAVTVLLAILGVVTIIQGDTLLGVLGLVIAVLALGIYWLVKKVRRFIDRQIDRAFAKFQGLLQRGAVRASDWPNWYNQNK